MHVVGLVFAVWARVHIGRNWGVPMMRKDEPALVRSGPHPGRDLLDLPCVF